MIENNIKRITEERIRNDENWQFNPSRVILKLSFVIRTYLSTIIHTHTMLNNISKWKMKWGIKCETYDKSTNIILINPLIIITLSLFPTNFLPEICTRNWRNSVRPTKEFSKWKYKLDINVISLSLFQRNDNRSSEPLSICARVFHPPHQVSHPFAAKLIRHIRKVA